MVCGPNKSYLWILARKSVIEDEVLNNLVTKATALGFEVNKLIYVSHD
ncbi:MAG: lipocalin family protein [bacterium]|nr:lipocalin family protein [bacterium]